MSKKHSMYIPKHPCVWVSPAKNDLREVVVVENFGDGDVIARFWIPADTKNSFDAVFRRRMKDQFKISIGHYSRRMSLDCPFDISPEKCVFLKR